MTDRGEDILARYATVLSGLAGLGAFNRNVPLGNDFDRPAIFMFDGDEEVRDNSHPGDAPMVVRLLPVTAVFVGGTPEEVGTTRRQWRSKIVKAVLADATLKSLTGVSSSRSGVYYLGYETSVELGRDLVGDLSLQFGFDYVLKPGDL